MMAGCVARSLDRSMDRLESVNHGSNEANKVFLPGTDCLYKGEDGSTLR